MALRLLERLFTYVVWISHAKLDAVDGFVFDHTLTTLRGRFTSGRNDTDPAFVTITISPNCQCGAQNTSLANFLIYKQAIVDHLGALGLLTIEG